MKKPGFVSGLLLASAMICGAGAASAQAYPVKPIRLAVTGVGSGGDFAARIIAQGVSPALGQQIIVDNRGSSNLPALFVYRAAPDGYTLCLQAAPLWVTPYLRKTPYDPVKDFAPVTLAITSPNILVIHPSLPVKSVREPIAEVGLPGYELVSVQGIFAPAGTPRPIIDRLNREIVTFLQTPEAKKTFLKVGVETIGSTPEEAAARVKSEMDILGKVIRAAGIKVEP